MRIAFIFDDEIDRHGGVQRYIRGYAGWLAHQGHSVEVVSAGCLDLEGVRHRRVWGTPRFGLNGSTASFALPLGAPGFYSDLSKGSFDVLHIIHPQILGASRRAMNRVPLRTAVVAASVASPVSRRNRRLNRLLARIIRQHTGRVDLFLPVSQVALEALKASYGVTGPLLPPPVDLPDSSASPGSTEPIAIVSVGVLTKRKNQTALLQAFSRVQRSYPEATLTIVGDGPRKSHLCHLSDQLGLAGNVVFTGSVPELAKAQLLRAATVAVFPAMGGESFGCVLVEALLAGARVVAADNPGYRETLEGTDTRVVDVTNPRILASAIIAEIQTPRDPARNRAVAAAYGVDRLGPKLLAAYEGAIEQKGPRS